MKKKIFYFAFIKTIFVFSILLLSACGSDDEDGQPGVDEFASLPSELIGNYDGALGYTGSFVVSETDATATISTTGIGTYTIAFSDGVPSLSGIKFTKVDENYISVSADNSAEGITIDGTSLAIGVTSGSNNWSFAGEHQ